MHATVLPSVVIFVITGIGSINKDDTKKPIAPQVGIPRWSHIRRMKIVILRLPI
jgi:hypothetical protein